MVTKIQTVKVCNNFMPPFSYLSVSSTSSNKYLESNATKCCTELLLKRRYSEWSHSCSKNTFNSFSFFGDSLKRRFDMAFFDSAQYLVLWKFNPRLDYDWIRYIKLNAAIPLYIQKSISNSSWTMKHFLIQAHSLETSFFNDTDYWNLRYQNLKLTWLHQCVVRIHKFWGKNSII